MDGSCAVPEHDHFGAGGGLRSRFRLAAAGVRGGLRSRFCLAAAGVRGGLRSRFRIDGAGAGGAGESAWVVRTQLLGSHSSISGGHGALT